MTLDHASRGLLQGDVPSGATYRAQREGHTAIQRFPGGDIERPHDAGKTVSCGSLLLNYRAAPRDPAGELRGRGPLSTLFIVNAMMRRPPMPPHGLLTPHPGRGDGCPLEHRRHYGGGGR